MLKPILLVFENKRSAIVDKTTTDVMQAVAHSEFSNAFCVGMTTLWCACSYMLAWRAGL